MFRDILRGSNRSGNDPLEGSLVSLKGLLDLMLEIKSLDPSIRDGFFDAFELTYISPTGVLCSITDL